MMQPLPRLGVQLWPQPSPSGIKPITAGTNQAFTRVFQRGGPPHNVPLHRAPGALASPAGGGCLPLLEAFICASLGELPGATARARRWTSGALAQWFPQPGAAGAPAYYSLRGLQFALQLVLARNPASVQVAAVRHFVHGFIATLERAATNLVAQMGGGQAKRDGALTPQAYTAICAQAISALAHGAPALLQVGYVGSCHGHTISLYLAPGPHDTVDCAIIDRAADASEFHPCDWRGRTQPLVMRMQRPRLFAPPAVAVLQAFIELSDADGPSTIEDFHACVGRLRQATGGVMLLEKQGAALAQLPGQSGQKAGTCTLHSLFGVLHFALYHHFQYLTEPSGGRGHPHLQALYKSLKLQCRSIMLQQINGTLAQARRDGDEKMAAAVLAIRNAAASYLRERLEQPHKHAAVLLAAGRL